MTTPAPVPQLLPEEIRWTPTAAGEPETREFFFGADTALKVRAPWWLRAEAHAGRLKLRPKVCGAFSGELAVCIGSTSPDPLVCRVLSGPTGRIYALSAGKVTVLQLNGEVAARFPVPERVVSLIGVSGNQILATTPSSIVALQH